MTTSLLNFDNIEREREEKREAVSKTAIPELVTVSPEANPYKDSRFPNDIYDYLLPDGSRFGLFADPYATMKYVDVSLGARNGRYWLEQRLEDHTFTEREIKLMLFLSEHRVATRNQISKVVFPETDKKSIVIDFLQKCRKRGIICAFSWVSPLEDEFKKPLIYGLTRPGAEAVSILFHKQVEEDFQFHPINFPAGRGPNMNTFYLDLIANELYSELVRIDRVISWQRRPQLRLPDGGQHHPAAVFEVIKDDADFRVFWVETIRVGKDWINRVMLRFKRTQSAYERLSLYQRPARVIIIVDGDSRIPLLAKLAEEYMPDVKCRFTSDERLLQGLSPDTFISWSNEEQVMKVSKIPFLQEGYEGMTASEYHSKQQFNVEEEDMDEYEE
ncbi:hypothetical protein ACFPOG_12735 [Paenibacillus aestuarii]|uniref:Uncharacterized protein n=1 Tax=Paenibacillus aestuarii TaxID=516965 RepID=A0ABW0K9A9_9BACL